MDQHPTHHNYFTRSSVLKLQMNKTVPRTAQPVKRVKVVHKKTTFHSSSGKKTTHSNQKVKQKTQQTLLKNINKSTIKRSTKRQPMPLKINNTTSKGTASHKSHPNLSSEEYVPYQVKPWIVFGLDGLGTKQLYHPMAAAVDHSTDDIYIADNGNNHICVYEKDGSYKRCYAVNEKLWDFCFTPNGDFLMSVGSNIKKLDMLGSERQVFETEESSDGIASDGCGMLYVCNAQSGKVQVLNKFGSVERILGSSDPGKLSCALSVAIHPQSGKVYVADTSTCEVKIYGNNGQYESCIGNKDIPGVEYFYVNYISFRHDGLLCITDYKNCCIHFMRDGRHLQSIGQRGHEPGQFRYPCGTTFMKTGDLIVCDYFNHRVQIFCCTEPK